MWKPAEALSISPEQRQALETWLAARKTPQRLVLRAQIILKAAAGAANHRIARELKTSRPTVLLWRGRFQAGGLAALTEDAPGRGRKPQISAEKVSRIVEATLHQKPPAATPWSTRTMARAQGVSQTMVWRIWDAHGLQPYRTRTFKLSRDPHFVEKLTDVVGLYLNPPDQALVLCVDEKSQIQAWDRTQPGLPLKKGRCGTLTHDDKRHGATTLFAALNVLQGTVVGEGMARHRHQEFLRFLRQLDRETPPELALHLILDNYGTHTHPRIKVWLAKQRRFFLHPPPPSSSWLNLIERCFRELTQKPLRRGTFASLAELPKAIQKYLDQNNRQPKPFVWTARVEDILAKVHHGKVILYSHH